MKAVKFSDVVQSSVDLNISRTLVRNQNHIRNEEACCPSSGTLNYLIVALASCNWRASDNPTALLNANLQCLQSRRSHFTTVSLHNSFITHNVPMQDARYSGPSQTAFFNLYPVQPTAV